MKMNSINKIIKSFYYAFCGLIFCIKNERNFRIHTVIAMYVLMFSSYYNLTRAEILILFLSIGLVLSFEMMNTALEQAVNMISPEKNPIAKIAKDVSAGAVLVFTIISIFVGIVLFWDKPTIAFILTQITSSLPNIILLTASIFVSLVYILKFSRFNDNKD